MQSFALFLSHNRAVRAVRARRVIFNNSSGMLMYCVLLFNFDCFRSADFQCKYSTQLTPEVEFLDIS
jgi:hypothetical protein